MALVLTKITGFAREIVLAAFFGAGTVSDAFILAFTIPDTLMAIIIALVGASYIPMYNRVSNKINFTQNIMTCLILIGLLFSLIFTLFPGVLIRLFAFQLAPETFELATFFLRYMVWSAVFILLTNVYGAYLEINDSFFVSGLRTLLRNAAVILGIVLGATYDFNLAIALGPIIGSALCMFILLITSKKHGYTYRPYLDIRSPELKQMLVLGGPILLSTILNQIKLVISRNFAATLPEGTISHLHYSHKIATLIAILLGSSLFTVLYPHMSKLAASDDIDKLKSVLMRGIMYIVTIMLPICIGVIILAEPGIRILFQRGSFTMEDTMRTAATLRMFAILLVTTSISSLMLRAFYALRDTKTPAIILIITVTTNIALNFLFINSNGAVGLALAFSLSSLLMVALLLVFLRKRLGTMGLRENLPELFKIMLATGIAGGGTWFVADILPLMIVPVWQSVALCIIVVVAAAFVYLILLLLFKNKIAFEIINTAKKFLRRKSE